MGRFIENEYKLEISKKKMKELGFKYDLQLDKYIYKFPVYKNNKVPLIFCKLGIDEETNCIWFNVYDLHDMLYAPYYNRTYGKNSVVPIIDKEIKKEINRLLSLPITT